MRLWPAGFFLIALSLPLAGRAFYPATLLSSGDWCLETGLSHAWLDLSRDGFRDQSACHELDAAIRYGLAPGTELFLQYPWFSMGQFSVNNSAQNQTPVLFKSLSGGVRFQLLEDVGSTPALALETKVTSPLGASRFHDYVDFRQNTQHPLTSAGAQGLAFSVGTLVSTYWDPLEMHLNLHYLTPSHEAFDTGGVAQSVDYGQSLEAAAGLAWPVSKRLAFSLESQIASTSATTWRSNGQNVLEASGPAAGAEDLHARVLGGIFLHHATEAYLGPTATFTPRSGFSITLACAFGMTQDSERFRLSVNFSRLFKHTRFLPVKRSHRKNAALSRKRAHDEIRALLEQADEAIGHDDLASALAAWREILRREPRQTQALAALQDYQDEIQDCVKQLYLEGMQAYVQNDYAEAISQWHEALRYNPADAKVLSSIAQTQKKMESIKQIKH